MCSLCEQILRKKEMKTEMAHDEILVNICKLVFVIVAESVVHLLHLTILLRLGVKSPQFGSVSLKIWSRVGRSRFMSSPEYERSRVHRATVRLSIGTPSGVVANLELGERSGVWRRSPQRGPGAEPLVGDQLKAFFVFGYPKGGAIFHLTSKFRKLRKPHIFQVTSD